MVHQDSVRILASLLRAANEARPILLLGAGASFSSGVPLAAESVRRIARRVFAEKVKGGAVLPEQVKLTEWQTWLQSLPWFVKGDDRLAENFPLAVERLLQPREYRVFQGVIHKHQWPFWSRVLFHAFGGRFGDHRDWPVIEAWGDQIALALVGAGSAGAA